MTELGTSILSKITNNDGCDKIGVEVTRITVIVKNRAGGESEELELGSGLKSITPGESADKSGGGVFKVGTLLSAELFLMVAL